MKRFQLLFLAFFCFLLAYSQTALQQFLNNPALRHAAVGVQVTNLNTGQHIVSHNADMSLTPASVLKLITAAVALETFGADYRYRTILALDADDPTRILVIGSGDPTLGSDRFGDNPNLFFINSVNALRDVLSPDTEYSIYVVDNLFGYSGVSPGWTWLNIGMHYAQGSYGISIFDNSFRIFLNTTNLNACPRIIRIEPYIRGLTLQNELTLNTTGTNNGFIYGIPFSNERILRGDIPGGRTEISIGGDIPDPGLLLGETLADFLTRAGFQIGSVETARADFVARFCATDRTPPYRVGRILHTQESRPMREIIREVNVQSNNHFSEHLIRSLGRRVNPDIYVEPLAVGLEFVHSFFREKGFDTASLHLYDGSGLAPQNAVSAAFLNKLLMYMYSQSNESQAFFDSLPRAGMEGTVRTFLRGTPHAGRIWVKSGSIFGVQSFSGYLIDGDRRYAFTILINNFNGTRVQVRAAIEQFLLGVW
jgi:D-alanyl-D-alanine carboxypeptidase/D-alanyl-D-alanine-endopeptidase (penicillin-binding protein 4)